MIILDTHIWVWWADETSRLTSEQISSIKARENDGLGVSAFSLWEVAKLHEKGRIVFSLSLTDWLDAALSLPGIVLIPLKPEIIVESVRLPGDFHKDPADQVIVATARVYDVPLLTLDSKILGYDHVRLLSNEEGRVPS